MGNEGKGKEMKQIMEKSGGVETEKEVERKRESLINYFSKALNMSTAVPVLSKS